MTKFIIFCAALFISLPLQAADSKKTTIIKEILSSPHPLHEAISHDLPVQTFVKTLAILAKRKADFNQIATIEGIDITPLAFFIHKAKLDHRLTSQNDIAKKRHRLKALLHHGANINRACFDWVRKKLESQMPVYDALELPQRKMINTLLEELNEPHLGLPPHMIELPLVSPFGNHEHSSYSLEGIAFVNNYNGTFSSVAYFMVKDMGSVSLKPIALNPIATKLSLMMLGGKIAPAEIITTLSVLGDLNELNLREASNLAFFAYLAPGFPELSSSKKYVVIDESLFDKLRSELNLPHMRKPLISSLGLHRGVLRAHAFPTVEQNINVKSRVLYNEDEKALIILWNEGENNNDIFAIRNPLAKILILEIALGWRSREKLKNITNDLFKLDAQSDFIGYLYQDQDDPENLTREIHDDHYENVVALHARLVLEYRKSLGLQVSQPHAKKPRKPFILNLPPQKAAPMGQLKVRNFSPTNTKPNRRNYTTSIRPRPWTGVTRKSTWGRIPRTKVGMFASLVVPRGPGVFRFLKLFK